MRLPPQRLVHALLLAVLALPSLVAAVPAVHAAGKTFTVTAGTGVADIPDPNINGFCSIAFVGCTLRAALMEANAAPGSTVIVPSGTFTLTIQGSGDDSLATGDLNISADMTIVGAADGSTVIRGGPNWDGGIFDIADSAEVQLRNLTISGGNLRGNGGGIRNRGALTLNKVTVRDNSALNGGGISNEGALVIDQSSIISNSAIFDGGGGGGIVTSDIAQRGRVLMTNSVVSGNQSAQFGGGILNRSAITLVNVTLDGNSADGSGGAIFNGDLQNTVDMNNVTITANNADANADTEGDGGGVFSRREGITLRNTIIAGNRDRSVTTRAPDCAGPLEVQGFDLIQVSAGCAITGTLDSLILDRAALLGPPRTGAGGSRFFPLLADSPAVDAGSPAAPGSGGLSCAAVDQLGSPRPRGARCDMGAVESSFPAAQSISFAPIADHSLGELPLVLTATASSGLAVSFTPDTPATCSVVGNTLTLLSAGICTVEAASDGDDNFLSAQVTQSFAIRDPARKNQQINFAPLPTRQVNEAAFALQATASSGLAVSFETQSFAVCEVQADSGEVKLKAEGICTLLALQAGNAAFNPATPVVQSFAVLAPGKQQQNISFAPLADQALGAPPIVLTATASSGLAVSLSTTTPGVCRLSASTLSLLAAGTCSVVAQQAGNRDFNPAPVVVQRFTIGSGDTNQAAPRLLYLPLSLRS